MTCAGPVSRCAPAVRIILGAPTAAPTARRAPDCGHERQPTNSRGSAASAPPHLRAGSRSRTSLLSYNGPVSVLSSLAASGSGMFYNPNLIHLTDNPV